MAPPADSTLLAGTVALVTGGAAGIGGGTSRVLAGAGAHVVILDFDADLAEQARAAIIDAGGEATVVVGDVRDVEVVERTVETALGVAGHLDVLVNNVGDYRPNGYFIRSTEDMWEANHASIFQHVLRCCRAVLPHMVEHGGGSIVNVSTVEAFRGAPGNAVYNAYNAAVSSFTKSLAVEHAKEGIRVNCIAPDMADTLQTPAESMLRGRDPELVKSWIPLGRFGRPEEYGNAVLFLASELSSYVTGHTIPVDGGTIAASGWYGRYTKRGFSNLPDLAP
jgi:NAD(P)-dependent dehydrogenase (short-subunit alcohol dehydrogenase family)